MINFKPITILISLYIIIGFTYLFATPPFEAGDELWHLPMVAHLENGNPLPVQVFDQSKAGLWKQQASQPPLYYYLGALFTFPIDTSDLLDKRSENPHRSPGQVTSDGNVNLTIHDPAWNQWQGALLSVRVVRFISLIFGAITVYCTYRIGLHVYSHKVYLALCSAAMVAFTPMFLFVSSAVNNDNLIMVMSAVSLLMMIRFVKLFAEVRWLEIIILGVLIGVAALSKIVGIGLLPLALGTLFIANWRDYKQLDNQIEGIKFIFPLLRKTAMQFVILFTAAFAVAGWWYIRNIVLYGDWKGWNAFIAVLGERGQPASLAQLWGERFGFMQSFWGLFGGVNIPLWSWVYTVLNTILVISVVGFAIYGIISIIRFKSERHPLVWLFDFVEAHFATVVCLLWTAAVVYGLIQWATVTWSSQGRLVFSALPAEMTLLTAGLFALLPERLGRIGSSLLIGFMFTIAALAPWLIIRPAYQPADYTGVSAVPLEMSPILFDGTMRLNDARITQSELRPGSELDVYLDWEMVTGTDKNWSVFVHLNDPVIDTPISQRDKYVGDGLWATSFLEEGQTMTEKYHLTVPAAHPTPNELQLLVGLYDFDTEERATTSQGEPIVLAMLPLSAKNDTLPNPMAANFENEMTLIGYDIGERTVRPTNSLPLTLYFKTDHQLTQDYSVSAQILSTNETITTRFGSQDVPLNSTTWQPDEVQTITLNPTINADTPPDIYRLILKIYTQQDGSFRNLQLVEDGRITPTFDFLITKMRVIAD